MSDLMSAEAMGHVLHALGATGVSSKYFDEAATAYAAALANKALAAIDGAQL